MLIMFSVFLTGYHCFLRFICMFCWRVQCYPISSLSAICWLPDVYLKNLDIPLLSWCHLCWQGCLCHRLMETAWCSLALMLLFSFTKQFYVCVIFHKQVALLPKSFFLLYDWLNDWSPPSSVSVETSLEQSPLKYLPWDVGTRITQIHQGHFKSGFDMWMYECFRVTVKDWL